VKQGPISELHNLYIAIDYAKCKSTPPIHVMELVVSSTMKVKCAHEKHISKVKTKDCRVFITR
jgi:hypothetical protein